jgi:long-chain acyl-CoA synthetase
MGLSDKEAIETHIKDEIRKANRQLIGYKQIRKVDFRDEPFEKTSTRKIKRYKVH